MAGVARLMRDHARTVVVTELGGSQEGGGQASWEKPPLRVRGRRNRASEVGREGMQQKRTMKMMK